jgi:hypothetical protein
MQAASSVTGTIENARKYVMKSGMKLQAQERGKENPRPS